MNIPMLAHRRVTGGAGDRMCVSFLGSRRLPTTIDLDLKQNHDEHACDTLHKRSVSRRSFWSNIRRACEVGMESPSNRWAGLPTMAGNYPPHPPSMGASGNLQAFLFYSFPVSPAMGALIGDGAPPYTGQLPLRRRR